MLKGLQAQFHWFVHRAELLRWQLMSTFWHRNVYHITGSLCGEFTSHLWIAPTKGQWCRVLLFSLLLVWTLLNKQLILLVISHYFECMCKKHMVTNIKSFEHLGTSSLHKSNIPHSTWANWLPYKVNMYRQQQVLVQYVPWNMHLVLFDFVLLWLYHVLLWLYHVLLWLYHQFLVD